MDEKPITNRFSGWAVAARMSGWLLVPIVGMLIGWWLDNRWHTAPLMTLGLAVGSLIVIVVAATKTLS